ncbi:MAG: potassium channel protein [Bacteroidia bacterium]|jgi:voltage-gated potassium channel|nr:potassium channel protein [Bacteroidia bacterium]
MLPFQQFRKLYITAGLLLLVIFGGTLGFLVINPQYTFVEALYMTVITIGTVGFREVYHPSAQEKVFIIFLIVAGFGIFAYAITTLTVYVMDGEFSRYYKTYKTVSAINQLEGHVIICGYGRNGRQAAHVLKKHSKRFVVIESKQDVIDTLLSHKHSDLVVKGDATQDEVLEKAGIHRASALITTLPVDADNLFIVLTARSLRGDLTIISRASDDNSDKKLKTAGANNVIMPDRIGGAHMASLVLKPDVIEFVDFITGQGGPEINLEEITYESLPEHLRNRSIRELEIRNRSGANIVGFKSGKGEYVINPSPETPFLPDGKLFVLGTPEQITKLKALLAH